MQQQQTANIPLGHTTRAYHIAHKYIQRTTWGLERCHLQELGSASDITWSMVSPGMRSFLLVTYLLEPSHCYLYEVWVRVHAAALRVQACAMQAATMKRFNQKRTQYATDYMSTPLSTVATYIITLGAVTLASGLGPAWAQPQTICATSMVS